MAESEAANAYTLGKTPDQLSRSLRDRRIMRDTLATRINIHMCEVRGLEIGVRQLDGEIADLEFALQHLEVPADG